MVQPVVIPIGHMGMNPFQTHMPQQMRPIPPQIQQLQQLQHIQQLQQMSHHQLPQQHPMRPMPHPMENLRPPMANPMIANSIVPNPMLANQQQQQQQQSPSQEMQVPPAPFLHQIAQHIIAQRLRMEAQRAAQQEAMRRAAQEEESQRPSQEDGPNGNEIPQSGEQRVQGAEVTSDSIPEEQARLISSTCLGCYGSEVADP